MLPPLASATEESGTSQQAEQRRAEELNTIIELSRLITQNLDLEQVFASAHQAISRLMPTQAFYITLRDRRSNETVASFILDKGVRYPPMRWPPEAGLSGYVIRSGESVFIRDVESDPMPFLPIHYGMVLLCRNYADREDVVRRYSYRLWLRNEFRLTGIKNTSGL